MPIKKIMAQYIKQDNNGKYRVHFSLWINKTNKAKEAARIKMVYIMFIHTDFHAALYQFVPS